MADSCGGRHNLQSDFPHFKMSQKVVSLLEAVSHTPEEMVNHTGDPHIPVIMVCYTDGPRTPGKTVSHTEGPHFHPYSYGTKGPIFT